MKTPQLQLIKSAVDAAYWTEYRTARRSGVPVVKSRGRWLATVNSGGQCDPMPGAEAYEWRGTLKEIFKAVLDIQDNFPECTELWIEGGFDGAENVREYTDGLYDPWVGSWELLVWSRKDGWNDAICI